MSAGQLFDKAKEAVERQNYDYAVELLRQVLRNEPDNAEARLTLRGCERRRLAGGFGARLVNSIKGIVPMAKAACCFGRPLKRLECYEDYLELNPSSSFALLKAGRAAIAAGQGESATVLLKDAVQANPRNRAALLAAGNWLAERGDRQEGLKYLYRLMELRPNDRDLERHIRDVEAERHATAIGGERGSFREAIRDKESAAAAERDRGRGLTAGPVEERLEEALREVEAEPDNVSKITRLANTYREMGQFDKAMHVLKEAHGKLPDSYIIRENLGDVQFLIFDEAIGKVASQLEQKPNDPQIQRKLEDLKGRRNEYEVKEYRWRVSQHPTDMGLRFRYGQVLYRQGNINEAVAEFQQAGANPQLEGDVAEMLGRCFVVKKQYDLAIEQFERAVGKHPALDKRGKELQYALAQAHEAQGDTERALQVYKRIYSADITFKDVAQKVESVGS